MPDFTIRADSVDVEQIMRQIRARIRDKRGVDYTEDQIRELAAAKLERFLDPTGVRSDLLEQFRNQPSPPLVDTRLFHSEKPLVRFFRRVMRPFLKLQLNPSVLLVSLESQAAFNEYVPRQFELMHNLVLELTRTAIEVKNLKMRLESLQSRLEFNERRARALEAVVQYRADAAGRARGERGESRGEGRGDARGEGRGDARGEGRREGRGDARGQQPRPQAATAPAPQPVPPQPPQPRPAPQAAQVDTNDAGEAGTEPLGGVDPITGGESVRTRRRRRRRRRTPGGDQAGLKVGATDEAGLKVGATDEARLKAGTTDEAGLKVGATDEARLKAGTTDEARLKAGTTEEAVPESVGEADLRVGAIDEARLKADTPEEAPNTWGTASAEPEGGDEAGPKGGATGDGATEAADGARLKAGTTDDQTPR